MITKQKIMVNNAVKTAEYKLSQHRLQGTKSKLNIFEVAHLMDALRQSNQQKNTETTPIFYSVSMN
jgi:hypothetical protein